ncbi:MAG: biliverdin-producing heme oxygenase [Ilumatobacteraceae bacterium]
MQPAHLDRRRGGSAVAMLRRATNDAHRRLERELGLMSSELTLDGYCALLVGFAAVHRTLDDELAGQLEDAGSDEALVELDIGSRRRTPALAEDLDRLGVPQPAPVAFPLTSRAGALGALYVSEGATLGGLVIAPHVRAVLGPDAPVAFFAGGVDVVARWATCRRVIDRLLVTPGDRQEAATVATALFDRFGEVVRR